MLPDTKKTEVMRRLNHAKQELYRIPADRRPFQADLRLRIAHYEAALRFWIDGKSEYSFVY